MVHIPQYFNQSTRGGGGGGCANIQNATLTVNDLGTQFADDYSPYNYYYRYSVYHYIVLASEYGGVPRQITGVQFYWDVNSGYTADDLKIYCANTTETVTSSNMRTDLSMATGTFNYSDRIVVFNQQNYTGVTGSDGWKTINFDTNFCVDGTNNLIFTFENLSGAYDLSGRPQVRYDDRNVFRGWYFRSDSTGSGSFPNVPQLGSSTELMPDLKLNY